MAAQTAWGLGDRKGAFSFSRRMLYDATQRTVLRPRAPTTSQWSSIRARVETFNRDSRNEIGSGTATVDEVLNDVWVVYSNDDSISPPYCFGGSVCTQGQYVFTRGRLNCCIMRDNRSLMAHEYIHVLQYEGRGWDFRTAYLDWAINRFKGSGPANPEEAVAYMWGGWIWILGRYEASPWAPGLWIRPPWPQTTSPL